jgi:hypothetical protein
MKINVCDVCFYGEERIKLRDGVKLTPSRWKSVSRRGANKIALQLCDEHKDYLKGLSYEQAEAKTNKLYGFE